MNLEVLIFQKLELTPGDTVTIIFDYILCTAIKLSTFLESSVFRLKCRYSEYISITTMKSSSWGISNGFRMLNYTSQWSSHDAGDICQLSIYLVDSCDMSSIHVLMKSMTMTFPKITPLTFCFENPYGIVSFLLTMIILDLTSIRVISAITGDEENCLFIFRPGRVGI